MIIPNVCSRQSHKGYTVHTRARRSLIAILILALITITGVVPAWALPDRPVSMPAAAQQPKARTAADLPKPPKAMTLAERRRQVKEDRHERSPMREYMDAPERTFKGKPHEKPDTERAERGPATEESLAAAPRAAAPENPTSVSAWATAYPGMLSIGGQVKLPKRGSSYTGMWLYVLDESGAPVVQQEIKKATDDPSGDTPDTGAWCYDWWSSNSYPTDQCFWWAGSALGGILEDGKKYYSWVFLNSADGTSSPGGTTSPLVEAFYTPDIPGAQAGICTCYAQAHRADPVNTATGMFFEQLTDASLVSPGVPLALERTYRSDSTAVGLLGRGWATPFDVKLTVATGKVTYRADDGASFVFTQASNGTYTAPAGSAAKLVKGTSDYTLTTPDHTKRTFTTAGQLTSVLDTAGKGLGLTYASGKLASVKDAAGRTTTFTVGADGLLSKVSLPDTTSVSYGYTGGLLTSVTDPAGKASSYAYDTNKRLTSYTDPAGGKVTNVYDAAGRIKVPDRPERQNHDLHLGRQERVAHHRARRRSVDRRVRRQRPDGDDRPVRQEHHLRLRPLPAACRHHRPARQHHGDDVRQRRTDAHPQRALPPRLHREVDLRQRRQHHQPHRRPQQQDDIRVQHVEPADHDHRPTGRQGPLHVLHARFPRDRDDTAGQGHHLRLRRGGQPDVGHHSAG